MGEKPGRRLAVFVLVIGCVTGIALQTQPASGANDSVYHFKFNVDATTHLKKLDQTIVVNGGTFKGGIDFGSGGTTAPLKGSIVLPPTQFTFRAAGILPLITATAKIAPTKPVKGYLDLATVTVTAIATFNIKIVNAYATGTKINLVGDKCKTSTPVSVTMSGAASFGTASVFSGTFTIPPLQNCGLATRALNLVMPGPGNTFTASATPKS
jgi:hypothetical protein